MKPKLLLHSCCAPCSIYVLQRLAEKFEVTVYFYDPNIHPRQEYIKRRDEIQKYAKKVGFPFEEGEYNTYHWFKKTTGLEKEKEKGKRCNVCFGIRLGSTAQKAKDEGYDAWASVLSISPHKDHKQISFIGGKLAAIHCINFIDRDWKKRDGFKIANEMSKKEKFYRQDYCGCIYSKERPRKKTTHAI